MANKCSASQPLHRLHPVLHQAPLKPATICRLLQRRICPLHLQAPAGDFLRLHHHPVVPAFLHHLRHPRADCLHHHPEDLRLTHRVVPIIMQISNTETTTIRTIHHSSSKDTMAAITKITTSETEAEATTMVTGDNSSSNIQISPIRSNNKGNSKGNNNHSTGMRPKPGTPLCTMDREMVVEVPAGSIGGKIKTRKEVLVKSAF
mmetsp:Transcript_14585/g.30156  ORF Transcript_14585/g.30156 Transcript_14585/m.30156 type:complete len:204 (+) Transcript_14585:155-766(+)